MKHSAVKSSEIRSRFQLVDWNLSTWDKSLMASPIHYQKSVQKGAGLKITPIGHAVKDLIFGHFFFVFSRYSTINF